MFDILIMAFLILINGTFAMSEIAVVSARKTTLRVWMDKGNERAGRALELAKDPAGFLSTVQVGITLVGILMGAYGGSTIGISISATLEDLPIFGPHSAAIGLAIVVASTTFLTIVLGEIVPKQIALYHAEKIATFVAAPISNLMYLVYPLVRLLSYSSEILLKLLGIKRRSPPPVTEEEVRILLQEGKKAGVFRDLEHDIVARVFSISKLTVSDIMVPRPDIVWLDVSEPFEENLKRLKKFRFSCYPVAEKVIDNLIGILDVKDFLDLTFERTYPDIRSLLKKPAIVPETISAINLIELFKTSPIDLAIVVDEYGIIQGIVTLADILKAVVGEVPALSPHEPEVYQRGDGSWLVDGMISIDKLRGLLGTNMFLVGEDLDYHTLNGLIMTQLGRIPNVGDTLDLEGYTIEVVDMDGKRVDKVLITPLKRRST